MQSSSRTFTVERFEDDTIRVTIPILSAIVTVLSLNHHRRMSCHALGQIAACITDEHVDQYIDGSIKEDARRVLRYYQDDRHTPVDKVMRVKNGYIFGPIPPIEYCSIAADAEDTLQTGVPEDARAIHGTLSIWVRGRSRLTTPAEQIAAGMVDDTFTE